MSFLHIFKFGKRKFVSGLFWQVLTNNKDPRKEARELAVQMKFDFMIVRSGTLPQAGFCAAVDGAISGIGSLAAVVSKTMEMERAGGSWMVAIELPDGMFAYVAMRDNGFLAHGDFSGTKEEVAEKMISDLSLGAWDTIIAPEDFCMPNSKFRPFLSFLPMKAGEVRFLKWWQIEPIKTEVPYKKILVAAASALLVAGVVGGYLYKKDIDSQNEAAAAMEKARIELAEKMKKPTTVEIKAWSQLPGVFEFFEACGMSVDYAPEFAAGWKRDRVVCSVGGAEISYIRDELGTTESFTDKFPMISSVDMSGNSGKLIEDYTFEYSGADKLLTAEDVIVAMQTKFQEVGVDFKLNEYIKKQTIPGSVQPQTSNLKIFAFSFDSKLKPNVFIEALNVPGLRVVRVINKNVTDWSYDGVIYAN